MDWPSWWVVRTDERLKAEMQKPKNSKCEKLKSQTAIWAMKRRLIISKFKWWLLYQTLNRILWCIEVATEILFNCWNQDTSYWFVDFGLLVSAPFIISESQFARTIKNVLCTVVCKKSFVFNYSLFSAGSTAFPSSFPGGRHTKHVTRTLWTYPTVLCVTAWLDQWSTLTAESR